MVPSLQSQYCRPQQSPAVPLSRPAHTREQSSDDPDVVTGGVVVLVDVDTVVASAVVEGDCVAGVVVAVAVVCVVVAGSQHTASQSPPYRLWQPSPSAGQYCSSPLQEARLRSLQSQYSVLQHSPAVPPPWPAHTAEQSGGAGDVVTGGPVVVPQID